MYQLQSCSYLIQYRGAESKIFYGTFKKDSANGEVINLMEPTTFSEVNARLVIAINNQQTSDSTQENETTGMWDFYNSIDC